MGKKPDKTMSILKNFKKKAEEKVKLEKLILFGSRARGDQKKDSDVDLILVSKDFEGEKSFVRPAKFYLSWDYDYDADIICLTPEELENKKKQVGIIRTALEEGISV